MIQFETCEIAGYVAPPLETNCYRLHCKKTGRSALIDAGLGAIQLNDQAMDKVILTHSHYDHTAGLKEVVDATGAKVLVHPADRLNVLKPGSDGLPLFFHVEPAAVDETFDEGDEVAVGDLRLKVLHTPGHSPGSVCFFLEDEKVLFSGDTLFQGTFGRVDFPHSSACQMASSLKRLSELPGDVIVLPGHGEQTTIQEERFDQLLRSLGER